jgi:rubrerythrin
VENIFAKAMATLDEKVKGTTTDIEALKMAVEMEDQGIKYYQSKADTTDDPFEKKFYHLLTREEGEHFISLLDTIEFLEDPQGYFSQLERGTMSF